MTRRTLFALPLTAVARATEGITFSAPVPMVAAPDVHYGFPRMVRAANGRLLLFYRVGTTHASDSSSIALRISADGGATWSAQRILYRDPDPARSAHNPVALVARSGRVILWISRYRFTPTPARREPGAWTWSEDHGATWTEFRTFDEDPSRSSYYLTDAIRIRDGLLGCAATFPPSGVGNCHALMWHSADDGKTWKVRSQLTAPEANRGDEVALLETGPGEILCLLRTRRQPGATDYPKGLAALFSTDGGKTWTERENLHLMLGLTLQRPFLTRLDGKRVLLSGRDVERKEVVAFLSTDNARTFGHKTVIDSYLKDGAYTTCVTLTRTRVLMVYYADSPGTLPDLRAVRLEVP
ncbi:MAG: exo-alpha-sialidase [Acidobacteria bacterium]|nr:exo-alpha-sialidase [Acidobacteriota bacterium]